MKRNVSISILKSGKIRIGIYLLYSLNWLFWNVKPKWRFIINGNKNGNWSANQIEFRISTSFRREWGRDGWNIRPTLKIELNAFVFLFLKFLEFSIDSRVNTDFYRFSACDCSFSGQHFFCILILHIFRYSFWILDHVYMTTFTFSAELNFSLFIFLAAKIHGKSIAIEQGFFCTFFVPFFRRLQLFVYNEHTIFCDVCS